jgi:hypothetical protein
VALYLPSFLFGIMLTFAAPRASTASKVAAVIVFAACLGTVEVAVVDGLIGALAGHAAGLIGVGMLTSLAFAGHYCRAGARAGRRRYRP